MPDDVAPQDWNAFRHRMPTLAAVFDDGIAAGQHLGAQVYLSLNGQTVAHAAVGQSRPGTPMTTDTLTLWMSAGKPVTAVLIAKLVGDGRIDLDAPVAQYIDGFGEGGKAGVTVANVLTHTGGFRPSASNWSTLAWPEVLRRIAAAPLEDGWEVGETAGYHVASGWYVLAEIARRQLDYPATDAGVSAMYREQLLGPLGMDDCWVGMPRARYVDYGTQLALTYDTAKDPPHALAFPNSEAGFTLARPGGNARGPVSGLGRFYEQLLIDRGDLDGDAFLPREIARTFTTRQRVGTLDKTFGAAIDWTYGFLAGDANAKRIPYGYGKHASPDAFGHSGNQSSCAFADPRHKLVAVWITNGLPGELVHQRRQQAANAAIYEDLGLA